MPGTEGFAFAALLVFYLYLLARWQYVRRPMFYLLGAAGLLVAMFGALFAGLGTATAFHTIGGIFGSIGMMVAFAAVVGACYGSQLPVNLPSSLTGSGSSAPSTPPPPAAK